MGLNHVIKLCYSMKLLQFYGYIDNVARNFGVVIEILQCASAKES